MEATYQEMDLNKHFEDLRERMNKPENIAVLGKLSGVWHKLWGKCSIIITFSELYFCDIGSRLIMDSINEPFYLGDLLLLNNAFDKWNNHQADITLGVIGNGPIGYILVHHCLSGKTTMTDVRENFEHDYLIPALRGVIIRRNSQDLLPYTNFLPDSLDEVLRKTRV